MEHYSVRKQIAIRGAMLSVWHALTDPQLTRKYFFGCKVESDWMVGGTIKFKRKLLWVFPFELSGRILKINRGSFLQYSLKNSKSSGESIITIELYEDGPKTVVSVIDDVGQEEGAEDRYERSVKGWDKVLNGLKEVVETQLN